jgi:hypothetical protein
MSDREGYLHDYLAASFAGLALGLVVLVNNLSIVYANWGPYIAQVIVGGLFLFLPAGFVSSYINFRFHRMGENSKMAGLSAGLFAAIVYTFVTLIVTITEAITATAFAGNFFIGWIIAVVFAFIFMMLGGFVEGMLEESPFAMPGFFNLAKVQRVPPPPPATNVQNCPTCGRPMRFVEQYNRWYCDYEKKYA